MVVVWAVVDNLVFSGHISVVVVWAVVCQLGVLRAHLCGSGVGSGVTTWCSQGTSLWQWCGQWCDNLVFRDHLDVQGSS